MKHLSAWSLAILLVAPFVSIGTLGRQEPSQKRETVLDRVTHVEKELITEIPNVPRLCDRLGLKTSRIEVGDCRLYVEEEGRGMPMVLVNGGPGGTHHCFHPYFAKAKDFARVIYYDQRGCGQSDYRPGPEGYSLGQAVSDLDAIRRALGIERWVVLGYSYGGLLAQSYALRYPERLAGLILLGAQPGMWAEMKPTRQYDFLSVEERTRMREVSAQVSKLATERKWSDEEKLAIEVYNNHLNGDWKRQSFFRPTADEIARMARYEWIHDLKNNFRGRIGNSVNRIDLTGAFAGCPIPTLVLEGRWDLTWNTDKPGLLTGNHPGSKLVVFDNAGHGVFDEDPDRFFAVLRDFIRTLPKVPPGAVASYKRTVEAWNRRQQSSPAHVIRAAGFGHAAMENLAKGYTRAWCDIVSDLSSFLKMGFAQYETRNYTEALWVFERLQQTAEKRDRPFDRVVALTWQGHVLDLLGRRTEAVARYQQVIDARVQGTMSHSQYGLHYDFTTYPKTRLEQPFTRVENTEK